MQFVIQCSGCKSRLKLSEKYDGKTIACPKCKTKIKVKQPDAKQPDAQQPDEKRPSSKPAASSLGIPSQPVVPDTPSMPQVDPLFADLPFDDSVAPVHFHQAVKPKRPAPIEKPVPKPAVDKTRLWIGFGVTAGGVMTLALIGVVIWLLTSVGNDKVTVADAGTNEALPTAVATPSQLTPAPADLGENASSDTDVRDANQNEDAASEDASGSDPFQTDVAANETPQTAPSNDSPNDASNDSPFSPPVTTGEQASKFPIRPQPLPSRSTPPPPVVNLPSPQPTDYQDDQVTRGGDSFDVKVVPFDGPGTVFESLTPISMLAFSAASGDLAVLSNRDLYILHGEFFAGKTGAITGPVALPDFKERPHLCFKRYHGNDYLLVSGPGTIWTLDPKTLQPATSGVASYFDMSRPRRESTVLPLATTGDDDDPIIYCTYGRNAASATTINLESGEIVFDVQDFPNPVDFVTQSHSIEDPHGTIVDRELTVQPEPDDTVQIRRKGAVTPLRFPVDRSWFVARDHFKLYFLDRAELTPTQQLPLPPGLQASNPQSSNTSHTDTFFDSVHNRLLFAARKSGNGPGKFFYWSLPIDQAKLPDRVVLVMRPEFPRETEILEPGVRHKISLGVLDPRAKVSLILGPDGATINENHLDWEPTFDDVGVVEFQFKISDDSGVRAEIHQASCRVGIAPYPISFNLSEARIADDGKHALVWNNQFEDSDSPEYFRQGRIALVRTHDRVVLQDELISMKIKDAALTSEFAVLAALDGYSLQVRRLSDWELVASHRFTSEIAEIETIGDSLLVSISGPYSSLNTSYPLHVFTLPKLESTQVSGIAGGPFFKIPWVRKVGPTWEMGNAVVDAALRKPLALTQLNWSGITQLNNSRAANDSMGDDMSQPTLIGAVPPYFHFVPERSKMPVMPSVVVGDTTHSLVVDQNRVTDNTIVSLKSTTGPFGDQSIKLTSFKQTNGGYSLEHAVQTSMMTANAQLYTYQLADQRREDSSASVPHLTVRTESLISSLSSRGPTTVKLQISGGTPPYKIEPTFALPYLKDRFRGAPAEIAKATGDAIIVDGKAIDEMTFKDITPRKICERCIHGYNFHTAVKSADQLTEYAQHVRAKLKPFYPEAIRGIPFSFTLDIKVTDSGGLTRSIAHPMIFDYPDKAVLAALKAVDAQASLRNRKTAVAQDSVPDHPFQRPFERPHPSLPIVWNATTPQEVSEQLRKMWPRVDYETKEFTLDSLAATATLENANVANPMSAGEREWQQLQNKEVAKPRSTLALRWQRRDGSYREGEIMRLDDNRLYFLPGSEPSQVGLQEMSSKSILETFSLLRSHLSGFRVDAPFNFQFEPESFPRGHGEGKSLGSGIGGFQSDFGCLPPKAIVDSEGKPLLSWRVMLLPYLGYEHLFSLFHLDEPWDSDHNAKLIPYMPGVYGGTQNSTLDPGKATIVGLVGDDAWFPVAGLRFLSDFVQPYRYTISQLETKSEHSVVWTAPVDLRLDDPDFQTKILVVVEEGPVIGGQQQPYKSFFHGAIGSGLLTKLPYDEQKLRATATIHRDGASVMSLRNE